MPRKIRNVAKRPPLSWKDKLLYTVGMLLSVGLMFLSLIYLAFKIPDEIVYADPTVYWGENHIAGICTMPIVLGFFSTFLLFFFGMQKRISIFGNPNYKPKLFAPTLKVYPLGSGRFLESFTEKERKGFRAFIIFLGIIFLLSILIYPTGLYPREVYLKDDTLVSYNMLDEETHRAHITSAQSLKLSTYSGGKHSSPNRVKLSIEYDEKTYTFYLPRTTEAVQKALYIKSFFSPEEIRIRTGGLRSVLRQSEWDSEAIQLLYELFEYTP
ncbi:MAG: hypothetical protein J6K89_03800 [Oscillospiraceae bacterium]|nr:hypothetical protein [Oscillospiraceae bacterium]